ncbi:hypothetical protein T484DRAFT_2494937 [Baffinella frigidus]|nr:hypothetical protein T484DRAFT_2494937 [Cryptophyta sp. CCMP2293]
MSDSPYPTLPPAPLSSPRPTHRRLPPAQLSRAGGFYRSPCYVLISQAATQPELHC